MKKSILVSLLLSSALLAENDIMSAKNLSNAAIITAGVAANTWGLSSVCSGSVKNFWLGIRNPRIIALSALASIAMEGITTAAEDYNKEYALAQKHTTTGIFSTICTLPALGSFTNIEILQNQKIIGSSSIWAAPKVFFASYALISMFKTAWSLNEIAHKKNH